MDWLIGKQSGDTDGYAGPDLLSVAADLAADHAGRFPALPLSCFSPKVFKSEASSKLGLSFFLLLFFCF